GDHRDALRRSLEALDEVRQAMERWMIDRVDLHRGLGRIDPEILRQPLRKANHCRHVCPPMMRLAIVSYRFFTDMTTRMVVLVFALVPLWLHRNPMWAIRDAAPIGCIILRVDASRPPRSNITIRGARRRRPQLPCRRHAPGANLAALDHHPRLHGGAPMP